MYPVVNTLLLSFTNTTLMGASAKFVGLRNYTRLFADNAFPTAIKNTWLLWILNFIPQIGIAMLLSVWFTNARLRVRGVGAWRALFYLPNLLMPAAVAALFFSLFSYYGPVNQFLVRSGITTQATQFLQNPTVARSLVIFIQWWMWFGVTIIILMAGMTSIPVHLYEAAMVDGASAMQMFGRITLPLLKPILIYVFVTSMVGGMQMFDIPLPADRWQRLAKPIHPDQQHPDVSEIQQRPGPYRRGLCRRRGGVHHDLPLRFGHLLLLARQRQQVAG